MIFFALIWPAHHLVVTLWNTRAVVSPPATWSASVLRGPCATTINAKANIFDDSNQVSIGYQTNDIAGTGSAGCGSSLVALVNWRNLDSGGEGSVSQHMFRNETNSISLAPGPGRIAIELTTLGTHFPEASRLEVVMHG